MKTERLEMFNNENLSNLMLDVAEEFLKEFYAKNKEDADKEIMQFIADLISEYGTRVANKILEKLADIDKPCKLNYEGDGYEPTTGELVYDTAICPCGREFEIDYDEHYDYCPSCGRKLDWSECENGTDGTKD